MPFSETLWFLALVVLANEATLSSFTSVLVIDMGRFHPAWQIAGIAGVCSSLGSAVQLLLFRWMLAADRPWMRRFVPSKEQLQATLARYPSASFAALVLARATPLPDAPLKIVAAVIGYPMPLYMLAVLLGSIPYYYALAAFGHFIKLPRPWLYGGVAMIVIVGFIADRLRRRNARG